MFKHLTAVFALLLLPTFIEAKEYTTSPITAELGANVTYTCVVVNVGQRSGLLIEARLEDNIGNNTGESFAIFNFPGGSGPAGVASVEVYSSNVDTRICRVTTNGGTRDVRGTLVVLDPNGRPITSEEARDK